MQLTEEQTAKVREWIEAGAKLSEIQDRLATEYSVRLTYMDARLLVDDLKLTPKDPVKEAPKAPEPGDPANGEPMQPDEPPFPGDDLESAAPASTGKVTIKIDQITRAGAMVSGQATFSDGKTADWYLDQYGRFGMVPPEPGYRPSQSDLQEFQLVLDRELVKLGF